jgi:hypothetical protein
VNEKCTPDSDCQIVRLKADIFDLLAQQDVYRAEIQRLEQVKTERLNQLRGLIQQQVQNQKQDTSEAK